MDHLPTQAVTSETKTTQPSNLTHQRETKAEISKVIKDAISRYLHASDAQTQQINGLPPINLRMLLYYTVLPHATNLHTFATKALELPKVLSYQKIMESHMTSSHPTLFEQFSFTSFIHQSAKTHHSAMDLSRHQHRKVQEVRPAESWLENPVTMTSPFHHPSDGATKKHKLFSAKSLFRILRVLIVVEHLDPSKPPPGLKLISKT